MTTDEDEWVTIEDVEVENATDLAILYRHEDIGKFWAPKSQIHMWESVTGLGEEGDLVVKRWFAEKKGLIDD